MTNIAKPVSVLVVTLALVWGGCGSQPGTPATAIPTAQRTGPPISGHVPLQTPTPLPKPQPPSSLAGVEITALRDGPDEDVPPGYVFFYPALRWEQWPNTLFRTFVDSAGTPHTRDLFSPFAERFPQGSGVYSWAGDATMGEILVSVCPVGVCGQGIRSLSGDGVVRTACHLCDRAADDEGLLFHSVDGGITWTEAGTIPPSDRVAAWGSRGPILAHPSNDPAPAPPYRFRIWPSGEAEEGPVSAAYPQNLPGSGDLVWHRWGERPSTFGPRGEALYEPRGGPRTETWVGPLPTGSLAAWSYSNDPARDTTYLVWLDGANSPSRALNVEDAWLDFWKGAIIADGSVLVRQGKPGNVFDVVRLDLRTGTSHVIAEFGKQVSARNGTWIDRAVPGNWAEVTGTGSCLNLRSRPNATAPSLACYADGVLLDVAAGESTADWLRVTGPDGQVGWVSAEFVLR